MVNIEIRAVSQFINSFTNLFISGDDSNAVAPSTPSASSIGNFSADEFIGDLWVPDAIQKKRK